VKVATLALLGITGLALGVTAAKVAPAARARERAAVVSVAQSHAHTNATATATATASARRTTTPPLRATRPTAAQFDRVDENGEPIIQNGRFAGWTQSQWRQYYGDRLDQMWSELNDAEQVLTRTCEDKACRDAVAMARVQVRDLRLRIDFDERDLASVVEAR
jgi:hypothetical protein